MHQREVELAFSGQRVAAERHGDLLHRDLEAGRRERLDEDVGRPTDSSKRGRAVGCHRMHQRQRRLVRAEERPDDATAVAALDRDRGPDDFARRLVGAEPEWVGRMDGCLSHLRIGSSLIDLQGYDSPGGRRLHAGGQGLPVDAPKPEIDPTKGSLDHFAINMAPYDPEAVTAYLTDKGHAPYARGQRYGADGEGYSIYLTDPEGTVVELKSGK